MRARRTHQSGFTLLEMTFVLFLMGIAIQGFFMWKQDLIEEQIIQRTIDGYAIIDEAVVAFRVDHNTWPTDFGLLSGYLPSFNNANGAGLPYNLRFEGTGLVISSNLLTTSQQLRVADAYPVNGVALTNSTTVEIGIPVPGFETIHNQFLRRSAGPSQPLTGPLHLNGHNIRDTNNLDLRGRLRFTGTNHSVGDTCREGEVALTADQSLILICNNAAFVVASSDLKIRYGTIKTGHIPNEVRPIPNYNLDNCLLDVEYIDGSYHHPRWLKTYVTRQNTGHSPVFRVQLRDVLPDNRVEGANLRYTLSCSYTSIRPGTHIRAPYRPPPDFPPPGF